MASLVPMERSTLSQLEKQKEVLEQKHRAIQSKFERRRKVAKITSCVCFPVFYVGTLLTCPCKCVQFCCEFCKGDRLVHRPLKPYPEGKLDLCYNFFDPCVGRCTNPDVPENYSTAPERVEMEKIEASIRYKQADINKEKGITLDIF